MAVAPVSNISNSDSTGVPTTLTLASVVGSGGNAVMAVFLWRDQGESMSGATYGGNAMTRVPGFPVNGLGDFEIDAWQIVSPAGTENVVGTWNSAPARMYGDAHVVSGADTSTLTGTIQSGTGTSVTATTDLTLTTVTDGLVLDILLARVDESVAPDAGQTERTEIILGGIEVVATSTEPASSTSTVTGWTWTTSSDYIYAAIPIRPAAGGDGGALLVWN